MSKKLQEKVIKKRKLLDISDKTIKTLSIDAIEKGTVFKIHAQNILEEAAQRINKN